MAGLYVHVPFCRTKCGYCRFVSAANPAPEHVEEFLDLLEREAARRAQELRPGPFDTLYVGGGTPSLLSATQMKRMFAFLRGHFRFEADTETTVELNPGDVTPDLARALAGMGVNRASVGMQTADAGRLALLGRRHTPQESRNAVKRLKSAGIANISVDLMVSLPGQTADAVYADIDAALALDAQQVTVYELVIEAGTRFERLFRQGRLAALPGEEEQIKIMQRVSSRLESAGYCRYELLSYARPGFESRHNLNYWHNGEYLGLGPGAYSYMNGVRSVRAETVADWFEKVARSDFAPAEAVILDGKGKESETLLLGLRLREGVEPGRFPLLARHLEGAVPPLKEAGLLVQHNGRLCLTEKGKLLAETVFENLTP